jgi:cytochrome c-type biogenesis protein CcmH/NrfG
MSMTGKEFNDRDEQAAWELLGRHKAVEPSFGFVERTMRRLDEPTPVARPVFWQPVLHWALAATVVVALGVGGWTGWQCKQQSDRVAAARAETYATAQQADYLEDFDVIASLDQLNGEHKL